MAGRQELVLRLPDRLEWSRVLARGEPLPDPIRLVRRSAPEAAPPAAALPVPPPVPGSAPVPAPPAPALLARPPASAHLARPPADERGH